jgi:hypothetical protein
MKKTYISPAMDVTYMVAEQMIAASITGIGGNSGIGQGTGEVPTDADVKGNFYGETIFDE